MGWNSAQLFLISLFRRLIVLNAKVKLKIAYNLISIFCYSTLKTSEV